VCLAPGIRCVSGTALPLHRDGDTIELPDDEGYVKGASTTSSAGADGDPDDHYLHESLFRWTGWSLVAPRPGRTLRSQIDETSGVQGEVPKT
jgi:hypothetical protein